MNLHRSLGPLAALFALLSAGTAGAQTIFVDTSNDVIDFGGAQQVADLPGPDGLISLPEAGLASDNTPGVQTIGFHIPQSDWQYQQFFPGRAVLRPFSGFRVFDTAILDATTQTAFTGQTNPDGGGEVVIWQETYMINNVGGAAYGFDNSSLHLSGGSGNVIQANTVTGIEVFDSGSNLIGGASPGQGNTGGFLQIDRASNNVVLGNTVQRLRVLGWIGGGQPALNNRIGGPAPGERNFITGLGTLNSQGIPNGFAIQLFDSIGTLIQNNWIGTTPDGMQPGHPYTTMGIYFDGENHNTTIRDNRIAGILAHAVPPHGPGYSTGTGIAVYGAGSGISILGNKLGLNANDQPLLGSVTGISTTNYYLGPIQDVLIGGAAPGEGNEIAGQLATGISVANTFAGVRITGNSIHDNGGLGIDLIDNGFQTGVTPNDPLDADSGGNGLQNFPVLQSATRTAGTLRVVGTLDSSASAAFTVEFFASPQCDASGFGEGQLFLGSTAVATDVAGHAAFDVTLAATIAPGWSVTSTARAANGSTSEFSACVNADGPPSTGTPFCFGDGSAGACPCANNGSTGRGCQNSASTGGALQSGSGNASLAGDTLVLTSSGELPAALSIFLQGTTAIAPLSFGDGLRCAGGVLKRLYVHNAAGGAVSAPQSGEPSISARSAALGDVISAGATRSYQTYYRDPVLGFCPIPPGNTWNVSSGLSVVWSQ